MQTTIQLYQSLLAPSHSLLSDLGELEGDIMILGAGGKMGPALCRLCAVAIQEARLDKKIFAVSRFSEINLQTELEKEGIHCIKADLLEDTDLQSLPDCPNILYLAGTKFGTTGKEAYTWAMNSWLPARVANKYKHSRIVAFSTGNVYPLTPIYSGGATELDNPQPVGEYAQSCLGRERLFEYQSAQYDTPLLLFRLNYANDVTYGVLVEIAKSVLQERPIDLTMGHVNAIWQGDANEMAIRCLLHTSNPPTRLNITGPETISVRWAANEFGKLFHKTPIFINQEAPNALLSNAAAAFNKFGYPRVCIRQMMELQAAWLLEGGKTINKPTHYQERSGQF
jgi:hypothetical protein